MDGPEFSRGVKRQNIAIMDEQGIVGRQQHAGRPDWFGRQYTNFKRGVRIIGGAALDTAEFVGDAAYSVGEDVYYTVRLGSRMSVSILLDRRLPPEDVKQISKFVELIYDLVDSNSQNGSLYTIVEIIFNDWFDRLPDCAQEKIAGQLAKKVVELGAKKIAKSQVKKVIRRKSLGIVERIVSRILVSAVAKKLLAKLGIAAGASATGVGAAVGAPLAASAVFGAYERAIGSAKEFEKKYPRLYRKVSAKNLELLIFLIDEPMQAILKEIELAEKSYTVFFRNSTRMFCEGKLVSSELKDLLGG